jgi:hypothetical protein
LPHGPSASVDATGDLFRFGRTIFGVAAGLIPAGPKLDSFYRFLKVEAENLQGASDLMIELQALMDELRALRPPRTFHLQK